jgi:hypothetical protein
VCVGAIVRPLSIPAVLTLLAQTPTGIFEIELWPGEGRPRFQVLANELALREMPSPSARIVRRFSVSRGQEIIFDETRYRTIEAGRLEVLSATSVTGRVLGPIHALTGDAYCKAQFPRRAIACQAGDRIEYLQYRAEGTCFVKIAAQVIGADPCPVQDDRAFRVLAQPQTEWWIRVVMDDAPAGWVMIDNETIKQTGRWF